ncbi:MAG: hypothetical protein L0323_16205 [Planctomycetes bacterium]|nr:hypothetical protein [Planctomycetota bacterium]
MRLRGTIGVWGETKPFPVMHVRATDVETRETLLEGDSAADGTYVLSREFPVARAPFQVLVEGEGEGLTSGFRSRVVVEIRSVPFDGRVDETSLHRGTEVRGRVAELFTGNPIPSARISQVWREESSRSSRALAGKPLLYAKATTDAAGEFRARVPVLLRRARILVEAEGYLPCLVRAFDEASAGPIEVRLARSDLIPRVAGRVLGPDGRPAAGARVGLVVPWDGALLSGPLGEALARCGSALVELGQRDPETVADEEGRFWLQSTNLGRWRIDASLGNSFAAPCHLEVTEARAYECELQFAPDPIVFVGVVRARGTGLPIPAAAGWAVATGIPEADVRPTSFLADERGEFRTGPLPRGPHRFSVEAESFAPATLEVAPVPGEAETSLVLELEEECRLRGTLVDEGGDPVLALPFLVNVSTPGPREAQRPAVGWGVAFVDRMHGRAPFMGRVDGKGVFVVSGLPAKVDLRFEVGGPFSLGGNRPETLGIDPFSIRFSAPGEERDLGRVVLRRKQ